MDTVNAEEELKKYQEISNNLIQTMDKLQKMFLQLHDEVEKYNKPLLTVQEFASYIGIGETLAKELLSDPACPYRVKIRRRVFVHKQSLDEELKKAAKYQLTIK